MRKRKVYKNRSLEYDKSVKSEGIVLFKPIKHGKINVPHSMDRCLGLKYE